MKKIALSISMAIISIATASALEVNLSSYSVAELKSLIAQINARISEIEKNNTQKCFITNSNLSVGDGEGTLGSEVKKLQDFLREKGHFQNKSTGYYGKLTRAAVIAYQASNGLTQTGEFDAATREKIHSGSCASVKAEEKVIKKEEKKEVIKETVDKSKNTYYPTSVVGSITLSQSAINGIMWSASHPSQHGFKVVWSKETNPMYPPRSGDYAEYQEASATKASLKAYSGKGTYYVRVCEYLNGKCGTYSNELKMELE